MPTAKVIKKKIRGIKSLIAEGAELDFHIKEQTKRLNSIKKKIRQHAAYLGRGEVDGDYGACVFVEDTSTTKIDDESYFNYMFEEDRLDDYLRTVTVSITKARDALDEETFDDMTETTVNRYHRVTFGEVEKVID